MGEIREVLIAGAGAIGSMVAWEIEERLPGAVSLLAGGERLERYRREGFVVNGEPRRFTLTDAAGGSKPDLVIVACKAHHLNRVIADLSSHIGPETLMLSLLNGITSELVLSEAFGAWRIPESMIVGTDAWHGGTETRFSKTGIIFFGDPQNGVDRNEWSPRVRAIADFFDRAGIAYSVPRDMKNRLWYKFMLNVAVNQVTAIARKPYRLIQSATIAPETREILDAAMREVIAIARAEGVTLTEEDIASVYATMDALNPDGKTSMCQDVEAGRKTEVEIFSGAVIELGRKHGIAVPVNETLFRLLRAIESQS